MMRYWLAVTLAIGVLSAADQPPSKSNAPPPQQLEFPIAGTLRLEHSTGMLTIEGWSRPDMEITTTQPDNARVTTERRGSEVIVTTDYPKKRFPRRNPFSGGNNFEVEYRIHVPATAHVVVHHQVGEVYLDGLSSDIDVTMRQGQILLHLLEANRYAIEARSDYGSVISDFPGYETRRFWLVGHTFANDAPPGAAKLNLRARSGDIIILKQHTPEALEAGH